MVNVRETNISRLNDLFSQKLFCFKRLEFERGLGIVDDAFYLTIESGSIVVVIKIFTYLRCIENGNTVARYCDLFLTTSGKRISKRSFRTQRDIEKTALQANLNLVNKLFNHKEIRSIKFSSYGDLRITFSASDFIVTNDNFDVRKQGRRLYEILFNDPAKPYAIIVSESGKVIKASKKTKLELFPESDGYGLRFIVARK